ncbi:hypothetical protein VI26_18015 [Chromobacterium sp. LK1]|uniref:hypothetical protein n=1 Tax=Chromobacterium sp. LK1 TaxID=1628193 RepID=UPI0006539977|nr:hypothetical protein [Chromobacterium sp. LK1]KMN32148.1 hypothetical protein VI26_18015 [Chromobacterium sp. LK1]
MKLDRRYQRKILEMLAGTFPGLLSREDFAQIEEEMSEDVFVANAKYLEMHGLIQPGFCSMCMDGSFVINIGQLQITHAGLDFLSDDGGLSAILGVVNVKLHADTIRDLLEVKLATADISPEEKKTLIGHLKDLPAEGLKHLTTRLIDLGLDNLPAALPLLRAQLGF